MGFSDLRDFLNQLEDERQLVRISQPISTRLEMTEVSSRVLAQDGPALWFSAPTGFDIPVVTNLFGTQDRIASAMGLASPADVRLLGRLLAELKTPKPPEKLQTIFSQLGLLKSALHMQLKESRHGACQQVIVDKKSVDLAQLPVQWCWPEDAGPLITWPLVVTKGPLKPRLNVGVYRLQVIGRNRVIVRWLSHRGGALDYQAWQKKYPKKPFPISVVIGADPAMLLAAVTPIPDTLSEYSYAGLLRGARTNLVNCIGNTLKVPANAEFVFEGYLMPGDEAMEGPFGDHTGYYNEQAKFPVMTIERITHRANPVYLSTYTGRPPDEPSVLAEVMNELVVPMLAEQFPEIVDFYLPPEGCSYRIAVISIRKQYPGHAQRIMMGVWGFLRQFMYIKYIIVVDEDISTRDWSDVIWAITTRTDPRRDCTIMDNTPIDYLDFASPVSGLGSKLGWDATNKWPGETQREWGIPIRQSDAVVRKVDQLWETLGV